MAKITRRQQAMKQVFWLLLTMVMLTACTKEPEDDINNLKDNINYAAAAAESQALAKIKGKFEGVWAADRTPIDTVEIEFTGGAFVLRYPEPYLNSLAFPGVDASKFQYLQIGYVSPLRLFGTGSYNTYANFANSGFSDLPASYKTIVDGQYYIVYMLMPEQYPNVQYDAKLDQWVVLSVVNGLRKVKLVEVTDGKSKWQEESRNPADQETITLQKPVTLLCQTIKRIE